MDDRGGFAKLQRRANEIRRWASTFPFTASTACRRCHLNRQSQEHSCEPPAHFLVGQRASSPADAVCHIRRFRGPKGLTVGLSCKSENLMQYGSLSKNTGSNFWTGMAYGFFEVWRKTRQRENRKESNKKLCPLLAQSGLATVSCCYFERLLAMKRLSQITNTNEAEWEKLVRSPEQVCRFARMSAIGTKRTC